jgi:hypothetical protein
MTIGLVFSSSAARDPSGLGLARGSCRIPEIHKEIGRSGGDAFLVSEDRNKKYLLGGEHETSAKRPCAPVLAAAARPPNFTLLASGSPDLFVKNLELHGVATSTLR